MAIKSLHSKKSEIKTDKLKNGKQLKFNINLGDTDTGE